MRRLIRIALIASLALAPLFHCFAADDVLLDAKRHLDSGNPQAAYDLLVPLQADRAGDPEYDFLLGSAALGIGRNTEAVFALERVLAVKPDATPARALIARAYFNLKETETAKREFENVRREEVPEDVARTIDRFLDAIRRVEDARKVTLRGYIEAGGGYDSNVNSATSESQVAVPLLGGAIITLTGASREQGDSYLSFGGGVAMQAPFSPHLSGFGGVSYSNKTNLDKDQFSSDSYDANLGLGYKRERDTFTLASQFSAFYLDDPAYSGAYRKVAGATGQWLRDFDARNQASAYVQYASLSYPDQRQRDADRYLGGLGYARAFGRRSDLAVYLGAYGGKEEEKDPAFPQVGHDFYGLRVGAQRFLSDKLSLFANASAEARPYHGPEPSFFVNRKDAQYAASGGMHFTVIGDLRLTLQGSYTAYVSNIPIYEFERWLGSLTLRYDF
jgi:tetratricopeptide (TPR) repeat protein